MAGTAAVTTEGLFSTPTLHIEKRSGEAKTVNFFPPLEMASASICLRATRVSLSSFYGFSAWEVCKESGGGGIAVALWDKIKRATRYGSTLEHGKLIEHSPLSRSRERERWPKLVNFPPPKSPAASAAAAADARFFPIRLLGHLSRAKSAAHFCKVPLTAVVLLLFFSPSTSIIRNIHLVYPKSKRGRKSFSYIKKNT